MTKSMWSVYLILCLDNSLYTGISKDVEKRFQDHLTGKGSRYTRSRKPRKVVYQETCGTKSDALKRELEIKSWSRNKKIQTFSLKI